MARETFIVAFSPAGTDERNDLVRRALFVSADGAVSPCVSANLPVSKAPVIIDGVERPYEHLVFANTHERSLTAIWRSKSYSRFRESFYSREVTRLCEGCAKLSIRQKPDFSGLS